MKNIKDRLIGCLVGINEILSFVIAYIVGVEVYNLFSAVGFELTHTLSVGKYDLNRILILSYFTGIVTFVTASSPTVYALILIQMITENQKNSKK